MTQSEKEAVLFALEEAKKVAEDFDKLTAAAIKQFIIDMEDWIQVNK